MSEYPKVVRVGGIVRFVGKVEPRKPPAFSKDHEMVEACAEKARRVAEDPLGVVAGRLWFVEGKRLTEKPTKRHAADEDDSEDECLEAA